MNTVKSQQSQSVDYRETYALSCAPFENRIEPRFFYASTALMQRLDLLTHLTQFGESVVLVTGPPGSGKTTLLGNFATQANSRWQICLLDGNEQESMAESLSPAFGADAGIQIADALSHWDAHTEPSQLLVIVIDNAERLNQQTCDDLCGLLGLPHGERIRMILFGTSDAQPRVKKALEQKGAGRSLQLLEVPRLSEEETASYLMYRLAVAGYSGESPFAATEVRAICKAADGRPAAVNRLAHQTLTENVVRASSKRQPSLPSKGKGKGPLWLAATGGLLILVAYLGWQRFTSSEDAEQLPRLAQAPSREEVPLTLPEPDRSETPPIPAAKPSPATSQTVPVREPVTDNTTREIAEIIDKSMSTGAAKMPDAAPETVPAAVDVPTPAAHQQEASPQAPAQNIAGESAVEPTPEPRETAVQAETSVQTAATADAGSDGNPHREPWLLKQPEDRYSLQLLGSRSEQSIIRFIEQYELDVQKTAYYRGLYKNAEWYVLMYGVYPSRDAALQQAETLPAAVRKEKPWPRDMKSVQLAIREAGE